LSVARAALEGEYLENVGDCDCVRDCVWNVEEISLGFVFSQDENYDTQHMPRVSSPQALADFFEMAKLPWR
jgi:hypothetical protein